MTAYKTEIGHNQTPLLNEIRLLKKKVGVLVADLHSAVDSLADNKFYDHSENFIDGEMKPKVKEEVKEYYEMWGVTAPDLVQDDSAIVEGHYNEFVRELGFGEVYVDKK